MGYRVGGLAKEYRQRVRGFVFGCALDPGMGLSPETRYGFERVCGSILNAGMCDSFGTVQLSGKPGEKRKHCKVSWKRLEARRWESVTVVSFVSPGALGTEGETHMDMMSLMLIYTPVFAS